MRTMDLKKYTMIVIEHHNINYQTQAINSLRKGIEQYDKRHGWRGPITNKINNKTEGKIR